MVRINYWQFSRGSEDMEADVGKGKVAGRRHRRGGRRVMMQALDQNQGWAKVGWDVER
jgi:hypothetical protein